MFCIEGGYLTHTLYTIVSIDSFMGTPGFHFSLLWSVTDLRDDLKISPACKPG